MSDDTMTLGLGSGVGPWCRSARAATAAASAQIVAATAAAVMARWHRLRALTGGPLLATGRRPVVPAYKLFVLPKSEDVMVTTGSAQLMMLSALYAWRSGAILAEAMDVYLGWDAYVHE